MFLIVPVPLGAIPTNIHVEPSSCSVLAVIQKTTTYNLHPRIRGLDCVHSKSGTRPLNAQSANVRRWTEYLTGSHYAHLEVPDVLAKDIAESATIF